MTTRPYRRQYKLHGPLEDRMMYSTRYRRALGRIRVLERAASHAMVLDRELFIGMKVATCGACLPAIGTMLWHGGNHALVWFDGADAPMVWPLANMEIALAEAAV
jgi:hypothetical protein